ncbi:MAG TPA: 50S ribosomal protein L6 [Microthrixaceae bacterium]|nr:50S ribosomal protein L6 [Microthrixaceae bacterium]
MSRIGKAPIQIPGGVEIRLDGRTVSVKGPKGELSRELTDKVTIRQEENELFVERVNDDRDSRAMHGLSRSLVANMIIGVSDGFRKELDIVGVGYRAVPKGSDIELALGFSHPVLVEAPDGISFVVPAPTRIEVHGIDKQLVGQVAADIRAWRKPEPYKGKGVRYVGEHVRRKAGKTGK